MRRAATALKVPAHYAATGRKLAEIPAGSVAAVVGAPGTGKTLATMAADGHGPWARRIVLDPYARLDRAADERGEEVTPWAGELVTPQELVASPGMLDRRRVRIVLDLGDASKQHQAAGARAALAMAWHTGGLVVVCEEAALYSREVAGMLHRVCTGGRHVGVRIVLISQSWSRLHADVRRVVSHAVVYAQRYAEDRRELRRSWGDERASEFEGLTRGQAPVLCGW